jgi:hypothetical protein
MCNLDRLLRRMKFRGLSSWLLACQNDFAHVLHWPYLESVAKRQRRMLADELYSVIHVPRLKDENAAELFLRFRLGAVGGCHFGVLPLNGWFVQFTITSFSSS